MADDPSIAPQTPENPPTTAPSLLETLARLWSYINAHKVVQWSIGYIALAYSVQQGVGLTAEAFEWPQAVLRVSMLLLALGLPVVATIAWYHGDRGSQRVSGAELTIISMLMVVGSVLFVMFVRPSEDQRAATAPKDQASSAATREAGVISLAVLPFVNLSSEAEQQIFSDGMTEEITTALARVPDLRVVARTSAFQFKGANNDLRVVGQALGATHLIEGSVRKEGNRLRITAQLIESGNGVHVWTESYDRELTGVFAIQEEIARAIAGALRVPLGLATGEQLVSNRSIDPESYQQYLRAKGLVLEGGRRNRIEARNVMEPLVERNPEYAPAWALLSVIHGSSNDNRRDALDPRAEAAARRAIELDPNLADGYRALANVERARTNWLPAEDLYSKALALDPNHEGTLFQYSNLLAGVGRLKEALAMKQQLRALEPFAPLYNGNLADLLWLNGQDDAAIAILKDLPANPSAGGTPGGLGEIARNYAAAGRYSEAADAVQQLASTNVPPDIAAIAREVARLLRTAPAEHPSPQDLPRLGPGGFVYLHIGAPGRALEDYEEEGEAGVFSPAYIAMLWHPSYAPARKSERFKAYVRKAGFVDYWRARGWPEFCRPQGADDFVCT